MYTGDNNELAREANVFACGNIKREAKYPIVHENNKRGNFQT